MGAYSKIVWHHFNQPKNVGLVEVPDAEGHSGGHLGGRFLHLSARVQEDMILELKFRTYGCAPAIASGSVLTEALKGRTLMEASQWDKTKLVDALGGLPEDKLHCAELAIDALKDLLHNLKKTL